MCSKETLGWCHQRESELQFNSISRKGWKKKRENDEDWSRAIPDGISRINACKQLKNIFLDIDRIYFKASIICFLIKPIKILNCLCAHRSDREVWVQLIYHRLCSECRYCTVPFIRFFIPLMILIGLSSVSQLTLDMGNDIFSRGKFFSSLNSPNFHGNGNLPSTLCWVYWNFWMEYFGKFCHYHHIPTPWLGIGQIGVQTEAIISMLFVFLTRKKGPISTSPDIFNYLRSFGLRFAHYQWLGLYDPIFIRMKQIIINYNQIK